MHTGVSVVGHIETVRICSNVLLAIIDFYGKLVIVQQTPNLLLFGILQKKFYMLMEHRPLCYGIYCPLKQVSHMDSYHSACIILGIFYMIYIYMLLNQLISDFY